MAATRSDLSTRIPEDVQARTRKAGVDELDWYAGRLELDKPGVERVGPPDSDATETMKQLRQLRQSTRREKRHERVAKIVAFLRRPLSRRHAH
jgi:hypothetical protein